MIGMSVACTPSEVDRSITVSDMGRGGSALAAVLYSSVQALWDKPAGCRAGTRAFGEGFDVPCVCHSLSQLQSATFTSVYAPVKDDIQRLPSALFGLSPLACSLDTWKIPATKADTDDTVAHTVPWWRIEYPQSSPARPVKCPKSFSQCEKFIILPPFAGRYTALSLRCVLIRPISSRCLQ